MRLLRNKSQLIFFLDIKRFQKLQLSIVCISMKIRMYKAVLLQHECYITKIWILCVCKQYARLALFLNVVVLFL